MIPSSCPFIHYLSSYVEPILVMSYEWGSQFLSSICKTHKIVQQIILEIASWIGKLNPFGSILRGTIKSSAMLTLVLLGLALIAALIWKSMIREGIFSPPSSPTKRYPHRRFNRV